MQKWKTVNELMEEVKARLAARQCDCEMCVEKRKHFHRMCDFRWREQNMGGQQNIPQAPRKMSQVVWNKRPTVTEIAQYLMQGNSVEFPGMVQVRLQERSANDVFWPIEVITRSLESELRRFGFLLERRGDTFSARSYRSDRLP